jgi:hypothetical protein
MGRCNAFWIRHEYNSFPVAFQSEGIALSLRQTVYSVPRRAQTAQNGYLVREDVLDFF